VLITDPDLRNPESPVNFDGIICLMAGDHFDGQVGGPIDFQADLLLAANPIKVGEIIRLVPLDATSFGPATKGGRTRHHARDFKFPDQNHNETPQELLQTNAHGRRTATREASSHQDRPFAGSNVCLELLREWYTPSSRSPGARRTGRRLPRWTEEGSDCRSLRCSEKPGFR